MGRLCASAKQLSSSNRLALVRWAVITRFAAASARSFVILLTLEVVLRCLLLCMDVCVRVCVHAIREECHYIHYHYYNGS